MKKIIFLTAFLFILGCRDEEVGTEMAEATDNCAEFVDISYEDEITEGDCPQEYTITRTFFAEDECDNVATAVQVITVVDTIQLPSTLLLVAKGI